MFGTAKVTKQETGMVIGPEKDQLAVPAEGETATSMDNLEHFQVHE